MQCLTTTLWPFADPEILLAVPAAPSRGQRSGNIRASAASQNEAESGDQRPSGVTKGGGKVGGGGGALGSLSIQVAFDCSDPARLVNKTDFHSGDSYDSGPSLKPGSWIMMRHVSCILLLEWSTTSQRLWVYRTSVPYA